MDSKRQLRSSPTRMPRQQPGTHLRPLWRHRPTAPSPPEEHKTLHSTSCTGIVASLSRLPLPSELYSSDCIPPFLGYQRRGWESFPYRSTPPHCISALWVLRICAACGSPVWSSGFLLSHQAWCLTWERVSFLEARLALFFQSRVYWSFFVLYVLRICGACGSHVWSSGFLLSHQN